MRSPIRIEMEAVGVNWIEYGQLKIEKELGKVSMLYVVLDLLVRIAELEVKL